MGYDSILRNGMKTLDAQTSSLQDVVEFYAWESSGDYGEPQYSAQPIIMPAIVEEKQMLRRLMNGTEVAQKASITVPRPITPNGASGRREPVDPRDKIILPSGYTGPILYVNGVVDPDTHAPYCYEIILG